MYTFLTSWYGEWNYTELFTPAVIQLTHRTSYDHMICVLCSGGTSKCHTANVCVLHTPGMQIIYLWPLCPLGLFIYLLQYTHLFVSMYTNACAPGVTFQFSLKTSVSQFREVAVTAWHEERRCKTDQPTVITFLRSGDVFIYRPEFTPVLTCQLQCSVLDTRTKNNRDFMGIIAI